MLRHLISQHQINLQKETTCGSILNSTASRTIDSFLKKRSIEEEVSRMAAIDGFSLEQIAKSEVVRGYLSNKKLEAPRSGNTVRKMIIKFSETIKKSMKCELQKLKQSKFSISFDEWTSNRKRKYLNINVHTHAKKINLGLFLIVGSCNAEKLDNAITEKLLEFGLSWDDIFSIICDGAAVNLKLIEELCKKYHIIYQICINHGTHLCVTDVLYKKRSATVVSKTKSREQQEDDGAISDLDDSEIDCSSEESEAESDYDSEENFVDVTDYDVRPNCSNYILDPFGTRF